VLSAVVGSIARVHGQPSHYFQDDQLDPKWVELDPPVDDVKLGDDVDAFGRSAALLFGDAIPGAVSTFVRECGPKFSQSTFERVFSQYLNRRATEIGFEPADRRKTAVSDADGPVYFDAEREGEFRQNVRELRQALEDVCYYWQDQQQRLFEWRNEIDGMIRGLLSFPAADLVNRRVVALDFRNRIGSIWRGTARLLAQAHRDFLGVNFEAACPDHDALEVLQKEDFDQFEDAALKVSGDLGDVALRLRAAHSACKAAKKLTEFSDGLRAVPARPYTAMALAILPRRIRFSERERAHVNRRDPPAEQWLPWNPPGSRTTLLGHCAVWKPETSNSPFQTEVRSARGTALTIGTRTYSRKRVGSAAGNVRMAGRTRCVRFERNRPLAASCRTWRQNNGPARVSSKKPRRHPSIAVNVNLSGHFLKASGDI
jgi:hypothetical protein